MTTDPFDSVVGRGRGALRALWQPERTTPRSRAKRLAAVLNDRETSALESARVGLTLADQLGLRAKLGTFRPLEDGAESQLTFLYDEDDSLVGVLVSQAGGVRLLLG